MDAKQACDKLNGFNFQNRYLVGAFARSKSTRIKHKPLDDILTSVTVLYHQPEKMAKSKEDLAARRESLAKLKQQHGID